MARIGVTISDDLLARLDEIAREEYTSRSDVIRQAVLFYIRSTGAALGPNDAELLLKNMKNRQLKAYLNKITKHKTA